MRSAGRLRASGALALASLLLLAAGLTSLPAAAAAPAQRAAPGPSPVATVRTSGYLPMADGTRLAYTVVRPAAPGRYPTLFEYSGYFPGRDPDPGHVARFVERAGKYAYVGVNLRGTGCSEGTFDFFQPQEAVDGAAAIEWIRQQPWSDGLVGMIGKSYPGITQLFVAAQQPEGLAAIAPGHFFADAYRDVARPGGIANHGFAALWSFIGRPSYEFLGGPEHLLDGDAGCLRGSTAELSGLPTNPYVQLLAHPYDDPLFEERSPERLADRLDVPLLATLSWQDEQLASRQTHLLAQLDDLGNDRWWATLTNGDHDMARTDAELEDLERFYDHFLRGEDNGWERRPRVEVWWEAGRDGPRAPGWRTALDHWSEARRTTAGLLTPRPLNLRAGGVLTDAPAGGAEPPSGYTYTPALGTQGPVNPRYGYRALPDAELWALAPPPPGTAAAFTTPPLAEDLTLLGSASADLWLAVTAPDVDLQVTLTEVRPDGQEVFVQHGWLRASQRALDPARTTELRPHQTHEEDDVALLEPGRPVLARVEVFPFGHLFRAGSRLRLWIEAPVFLPTLWAFTPSPVPAAVTVLHDAAHPSRLVLPEVPDGAAQVPTRPRCGTVIRQPCRPDPLGSAAAATPPGEPARPNPPAPEEDGPPPGPAAGRRALPATGGPVPAGGALAVAAAAIGLAHLGRRVPCPPAPNGTNRLRSPGRNPGTGRHD